MAILNEAKSSPGFLDIKVWHLPTAVHETLDGVNPRIAAAQQVYAAGISVASLLNQLADQAWAQRVSGSGMDPLSAVVLADGRLPAEGARGRAEPGPAVRRRDPPARRRRELAGWPGYLAPELTNASSGTEISDANPLTYQGQNVFDQGGVHDCVAASTVIAQASVDPVTMLDPTTGGTADGDDSPAAVQQRVQKM